MINKVKVPNVQGLTFEEAKQKLKECNLVAEFDKPENEYTESSVISEQIPAYGVEVFEQSTIIVK